MLKRLFVLAATMMLVVGPVWVQVAHPTATVHVQIALADDAAAVAAPVVTAPSLPGIIDAAGNVNWWLLAGVVGTVLWTNVAMILLKKLFPRWDSKGWAPPVIGVVTAVLGAATTGQIHSVPTLVAWIIGGVGAGASASSLRDSMVGK